MLLITAIQGRCIENPGNRSATINFFVPLALLSAWATVLIGVLGLFGWGLGLRVLTSVRSSYIPIALSTCIALLVQGTILIVHLHWPSHARRWPFVVQVAGNRSFRDAGLRWALCPFGYEPRWGDTSLQ
jgi:hypothetical protein